MKRLAVLFLGLILVACSSPSKAEQEYNLVRTQLLEGHDVVMKDMMQLNTLIQKIEADSTLQTESAYTPTLANLKQAHDLMFAWMHGLSENFPHIADAKLELKEEEYAKKLEKLKGYQKSLDDVESKMKSSIAQGKDLLN